MGVVRRQTRATKTKQDGREDPEELRKAADPLKQNRDNETIRPELVSSGFSVVQCPPLICEAPPPAFLRTDAASQSRRLVCP